MIYVTYPIILIGIYRDPIILYVIYVIVYDMSLCYMIAYST